MYLLSHTHKSSAIYHCGDFYSSCNVRGPSYIYSYMYTFIHVLTIFIHVCTCIICIHTHTGTPMIHYIFPHIHIDTHNYRCKRMKYTHVQMCVCIYLYTHTHRSPADILLRKELATAVEKSGGRVKVVHVVGDKVLHMYIYIHI